LFLPKIGIGVFLVFLCDIFIYLNLKFKSL